MPHCWIMLAHVEQRPFTSACRVTWPSATTVAAAGETVTVTLFGSYPPPVPQPVMTISRTSVTAHSLFEFTIDPNESHNSTWRPFAHIP
jgi:hypothetical protein